MRPTTHSSLSLARFAGWLRWVLVLVLAADLVTSPFHHHVHEVGQAIFPVEDESGFEGSTLHVEADDHHHLGHSLSLLSQRAPEVEKAAFAVQAALPAGVSGAPAGGQSVHEKPLGTPEPVPIASSRFWRPASRAPPFVHV
jgi:hypothetical protein